MSAQRHGPPPGHGGSHPPATVRVGVGFGYGYYDPFFYGPWFGSWWYPYPLLWGPPYGYYGAAYDYETSVRLQVTPGETEVYVDSYLAGTVNQFDGFFERLRLRPGQHEITLYLDGHRSVTQTLYLQPGGDFRLKHTMAPLAPGETPSQRPEPPPAPPAQSVAPPPPTAASPPVAQTPGVPPAPSSGLLVQAPRFGQLAIRVQPPGAEVFIDGDRWDGFDRDQRLVVQVAEGRHRIDVRKDGYDDYSTDVQVRAGETASLNVSLPRK